MKPAHWVAVGAALPLAAAVVTGGLTFYASLALDVLRGKP